MWDIKFCKHVKNQFRSELRRNAHIIRQEKDKKAKDEQERKDAREASTLHESQKLAEAFTL